MPPEPPAGLAWHGGALRLVSADDAHLVIAVDGATITFTPEGSDGFAAQVAASASRSRTCRLCWMPIHEGFYGSASGPIPSITAARCGRCRWSSTLTAEGADNEDHVPVPLVIGTTGWAMFVESKRPGAFEVARARATRASRRRSAPTRSRSTSSAAAPLDVPGRYFDVTGYPRLPAPWALGPWIWRDENASQAQVLDDIQRDSLAPPRDHRRVVRPAVLRRPSSTFDWMRRVPDPHAMLSALHDAGLRYGSGHAVHRRREQADPAQRSRRERARVLPSAVRLAPNPWGKPIDFTNPDGLRVVATGPRARTPTRWRRGLQARLRRGRRARACSACARRGCSPMAATSARCTTATSCSITAYIARCCRPKAGSCCPHRPLGRSRCAA